MMTTQTETTYSAYGGGRVTPTSPIIVGRDTSNTTNNVNIFNINDGATPLATPMLIDDDTIFLTNVESGGRKLIFSPPLIITPSYDESLQLYTYEDNQLGISVFAETKGCLKDDLCEQLFVLWDVYALESDPNRLTNKARLLQIALLRRFKEVV